MLEEAFWKDYQQKTRNPITRFFNKQKIDQMEQEINTSIDYISSYDPQALDMDSVSEYLKNMDKIQEAYNTLERQNDILTKAFLLSDTKKQSVVSRLNDMAIEKDNFGNIGSSISQYEKLTSQLNNQIGKVTQLLESEGLYLSTSFYPTNELRSSEIEIGYKENFSLEGFKSFDEIPSTEELLLFAKENELLTRVPEDIRIDATQQVLGHFLAKMDTPYSWSESINSFRENNNEISVEVFNTSTDIVRDRLIYNAANNQWKSENYDATFENTQFEFRDIMKHISGTLDERFENAMANKERTFSHTAPVVDIFWSENSKAKRKANRQVNSNENSLSR